MDYLCEETMKKFALTTLALAAAAFAGESFGGIGVTIYAVKDGVLISDVIPGSPAASAGLESMTLVLSCPQNGHFIKKSSYTTYTPASAVYITMYII